MRIAHLSLSFLPTIGGAEVAAHNIAAHQALAGHDVTLIAPFRSWTLNRRTPRYSIAPLLPATLSIDAHTLQALKGLHPSIQLRIWNRMLASDVWHVHVLYPGCVYAARALAGRARRPGLVATAQGVDIQMDSCISYGLRLDARIDRRLREAVRQFDAVGAISEDVFRQYLSLGLEAESIRTIPNGTVTGRFGSAPEDLWCAKNRLNIQDRRPIVLTVGRNHPKKGFVAIPDVARHLNKQGLEFYWLLVGRGMTDLLKGIAPGDPLRETLIPIEELPPAACAKGTLGPSEELLSYYAMSDVFAFPSNMEGLPLVGVEALAAGLPIVATSAPGCVDLVSDNVNGLLSAPGDHSAMARNIESLLRDPVRRDRLARNSQELAPAYDWDRVADQYIELYRDICSQGL